MTKFWIGALFAMAAAFGVAAASGAVADLMRADAARGVMDY